MIFLKAYLLKPKMMIFFPQKLSNLDSKVYLMYQHVHLYECLREL